MNHHELSQYILHAVGYVVLGVVLNKGLVILERSIRNDERLANLAERVEKLEK